MACLNGDVHQGLLLFIKMLKVVKVSQEIEAVGFFENLLVPLHAANGLAVFKDLDGLSFVTL
jgi:hypothetical protein